MAVILAVERVTFGHPSRPIVVEDASFSVAEGEVFCLLGPNGAGKTTLLRSVLGIHPLTAGRILLCGQPLVQMSRRAVARTIAYVPQSSASSAPVRARDMVVMGRSPHLAVGAVPSDTDEARAYGALERLEITHLWERPFDEMSGGERQLVLIARALCQEAKLLVMDEPTAHLDYGNQVRILKTVNQLRESGYGIVMTAHNPDHAFLSATHVALLADGRLSAAGRPESVVTSERLSALYKTAIRVVTTSREAGSGEPIRACVPLL